MYKNKVGRSLFIFIILIVLIFIGSIGGLNIKRNKTNNTSVNPLIGQKSEEYYMVTFLSGIEYWKGCYSGFEEAGNLYGVKTVYTGGTQYDANQEVTILEQIIAKKPAGIAVSCINPEALKVPIQKAMAAGIPVVTFDADSPDSGRYSFLGTGNEYAGSVAAKALYDQVGSEGGEVVIITNANQLNNEQRVLGFKNAIEKEYKSLKLVQIGSGNADQTEAAKLLSAFLQVHPNIKGVFCTEATGGVGAATAVKEANMVGKVKIVSFDTDKGTLDAIKSGVISATIAQGTYVMGYQSMNFLYQLRHELINPAKDWKSKGITPVPPFVDTGINIITKKNVDSFYSK
jgi:ribose transport system substrate-binding protein